MYCIFNKLEPSGKDNKTLCVIEMVQCKTGVFYILKCKTDQYLQLMQKRREMALTYVLEGYYLTFKSHYLTFLAGLKISTEYNVRRVDQLVKHITKR